MTLEEYKEKEAKRVAINIAHLENGVEYTILIQFPK